MILKDYLARLLKVAELYPEALGWEVVYSRDDEGNGFQLVHFSPSAGYFDNGEFETDMDTDNKPNSVCVN